MSYVPSTVETIKTDVASFMIEQRNVGFADNDGRWIAEQLAELYWSGIGVLRQKRAGTFLGVYDTRESAVAACHAALAQPVQDEMVRSMGRVSC